MKTIKVAPIDEIKIELKDKTYICSFNMLSMAYIQDELTKLNCDWTEITQMKMCQLILYGGIKSNDEEFTFEDATKLVRILPPSSYGEIMSIYTESVMSGMDKKAKDNLKKLTAQYMAKHQKSTSA